MKLLQHSKRISKLWVKNIAIFAIGTDLIEILDKQKDEQKNSELINCLFWSYENTPCSYCRHNILKILINLEQISPVMIEECLHDCSPKIRELVTVIT